VHFTLQARLEGSNQFYVICASAADQITYVICLIIPAELTCQLYSSRLHPVMMAIMG